MTVHGNVIDISGSRTIKSTTDGGRLKIYGAKVGDDTTLDHGNAESSIINIPAPRNWKMRMYTAVIRMLKAGAVMC